MLKRPSECYTGNHWKAFPLPPRKNTDYILQLLYLLRLNKLLHIKKIHKSELLCQQISTCTHSQRHGSFMRLWWPPWKKNRFNNLVTPGYINTYKATNHIKAYHTRFHLLQAVVGAKGLVNIYRSKRYRRKLCPTIEFLGGGPGKRVHFHGNEAIPLGLWTSGVQGTLDDMSLQVVVDTKGPEC